MQPSENPEIAMGLSQATLDINRAAIDKVVLVYEIEQIGRDIVREHDDLAGFLGNSNQTLAIMCDDYGKTAIMVLEHEGRSYRLIVESTSWFSYRYAKEAVVHLHEQDGHHEFNELEVLRDGVPKSLTTTR